MYGDEMGISFRKYLPSVGLVTALLILGGQSPGPASASENGAEGFRGIPVTSSLTSSPGELSQIDQLDLVAYQGTWNQIAVLPQIFSLQCARDTRATYEQVSESTIRVINTCTDWFGNPSGIEGTARVTDPGTKASLRVAFKGVPFQNPDGPANYRVTWISADGETVIVGNPERTAGFVLSRKADLMESEWRQVRDTVAERGYNPCTFITSPVTGGVEGYRPLCTL